MHLIRSSCLTATLGTSLTLGQAFVNEQQAAYESWNNTFNSSATISAVAIAAVNLTTTDQHNAEVALRFEQSNWATGSVSADPFYEVPANASHAPIGSVIKVEYNTSVSQFALPLDTAMSRFLYMSETVNGSAVPVSAYILWPYLPRTQPNGRYQTVAFAHGTTDVFPECGPSHARPLQYAFGVPYNLALQGYVVVATDYQGLGVYKTHDGISITHPYLFNTASANDVVYSVQAAQAAFPMLSKEFVVIGHSQGGSAAWAAAQRQAKTPVAGYLGTIAGSPATNLTESSGNDGASFTSNAVDKALLRVANGIGSVYPTFQYSDWLTPFGISRLKLGQSIGGCGAVNSILFQAPDGTLSVPSYPNTSYFIDWTTTQSNGGQPIGAPMLVLQGKADPTVDYLTTSQSVKTTCELYPTSKIEYLLFAGVTHSPAMWVSQWLWLDWIADRFAGKNLTTGCSGKPVNHTSGPMPVENYLANQNWFIEWAVRPVYETDEV